MYRAQISTERALLICKIRYQRIYVTPHTICWHHPKATGSQTHAPQGSGRPDRLLTPGTRTRSSMKLIAPQATALAAAGSLTATDT